jgi:hypothetical protein
MNYPFSAAALAIMHIMWNVNEKTRYTIKMLLGIMLVSTLLIQVMIVYYVNKKDETPERAACYKHISDYTAKPYIYLSAGSWAFQKNYSSYDLFYFDNIQHQLAIDHMWMLPWLYNHLDDKNAYVVKDYIRKNMIEALHRSDNVSIIVVVSRQHEKLPENFNILQFMRDNLDLKSELDGYVKVDNIDGCESYQVDKTEIWQKSLANYNR